MAGKLQIETQRAARARREQAVREQNKRVHWRLWHEATRRGILVLATRNEIDVIVELHPQWLLSHRIRRGGTFDPYELPRDTLIVHAAMLEVES